MKKHPEIFTQETSVPNFSQNGPFLKPPGCPKVLGHTRHDRQTDTQTLTDSSSTEVKKKHVIGEKLIANFRKKRVRVKLEKPW